jgi:hypothetical protein
VSAALGDAELAGQLRAVEQVQGVAAVTEQEHPRDLPQSPQGRTLLARPITVHTSEVPVLTVLSVNMRLVDNYLLEYMGC